MFVLTPSTQQLKLLLANAEAEIERLRQLVAAGGGSIDGPILSEDERWNMQQLHDALMDEVSGNSEDMARPADIGGRAISGCSEMMARCKFGDRRRRFLTRLLVLEYSSRKSLTRLGFFEKKANLCDRRSKSRAIPTPTQSRLFGEMRSFQKHR
jgi:hypothetical protein